MKTAEEVAKIIAENSENLAKEVDKKLDFIIDSALLANAINPAFALTEENVKEILGDCPCGMDNSCGKSLRDEVVKIAKSLLEEHKYEVWEKIRELDQSGALRADSFPEIFSFTFASVKPVRKSRKSDGE